MFNLDEYTTVAERIKIFREGYPMGRVMTQLIHESETRIVFRCELYRDDVDTRPFSTGYAREMVSDRGVNKDFALENCETSSIGVACKNAGIGTEKNSISREEAAKVNRVKEKDALIQQTRAKMQETAKQPIPVAKADDPWTTWESPQAVTMETAVETVQQTLGGTTEKVLPRCPHGDMVWKTGTSRKTNEVWGHWRCINHILGDAERCEPVWAEIKSDGTWGPKK